MEDRIYTDIKVYRFKVTLNKMGDLLDEGVEFRSDGPVPICNDSGKIIGFGTVQNKAKFALLDCAIDPSNPERLDLEVGARNHWIDAVLEFRGFMSSIGNQGFMPTIAYIRALQLTDKPVSGQDPIDQSSVILS